MGHLYPKLFIGLIIGFILFTIIGTLTHEAGHWVVARYFDFEPSIHYAYTDFDKMPATYQHNADTINDLRGKYKLIPKRGERYLPVDSIDFPEKPYYESLIRQQRQTLFPILLGGPIQTMTTGTIGVGILILKKRWWKGKKRLSLAIWLVIFIALFWLRQSFNLLMATHSRLMRGQWPNQLDEVTIANDLQIWPATISLITGLAGFGVLTFITLQVIPRAQRLTFLLCGLVGGCLGFWIWLIWLGPQLMP